MTGLTALHCECPSTALVREALTGNDHEVRSVPVSNIDPVTQRWPGRFSRSAEREAAVRGIRGDAVSAFLDMDKRQGIAAAGVQSIEQMHTRAGAIESGWATVETQCFAAGAQYLAASDRPETDVSEQAFAAFDTAIRSLREASASVDRFYEAHRSQLEHATAAMAAVPRLAQDARAVAETALRRIDESEPSHGYSSVVAARNTLIAAVDDLDRSASARDAAGTRTAAAHVRSAAEDLRSALSDAPAKADSARKALASVRTRLQAVGTKADGIGPAYSALLREFVAASSNDLAAARDVCGTHMAEARTDIDSAATTLTAGDPERTLDLVQQARAHLGEAEERIEAVVGRLTRLRAVRDDPQSAERTVRFHLRDAQLLAVDRGLVAEWGSVLDAQLARLERAHRTLDVPRPDYWTYLQDIDSIGEFISGVVDRMRGRHDR